MSIYSMVTLDGIPNLWSSFMNLTIVRRTLVLSSNFSSKFQQQSPGKES